MELLKRDSAWFLSPAGSKVFSDLTSLEDRSVFLYSYLRTVAKPEFEQDRILFKIAFFLADGVMGSSLPYQSYPDVIHPGKNPFVNPAGWQIFLDAVEARCVDFEKLGY